MLRVDQVHSVRRAQGSIADGCKRLLHAVSVRQRWCVHTNRFSSGDSTRGTIRVTAAVSGNVRSRDTQPLDVFDRIKRVTDVVSAAVSRFRGLAITLRSVKIGYGRVSTRDQHPDAQHDALTAAGCDQIYLDVVSGKLARRPELDRALLSANRPGDQIVVTKLDRLGRSLEHLIDLSNALAARGVDLVVLDQGIDTSTAVGRMFFQILGAIAEFEHALMSERTIDGLAAARARGRTGGQKPTLGPRQVALAAAMYAELGPDGKRRYTVAQIAAEFGVTRPTIYRHLSAEK